MRACLCLFVFFWGNIAFVWGQAAYSVVGSAGGRGTVDNINMDYTLGEAFVADFTISSTKLYSGFHNLLDNGIYVWPGDANNDHTCNIADFFLTASGFGNTGIARLPEHRGVLWQAYPATSRWSSSSQFQGNLINNVYIDANGDGVINLFDVAVTVLNRGQSH